MTVDSTGGNAQVLMRSERTRMTGVIEIEQLFLTGPRQSTVVDVNQLLIRMSRKIDELENEINELKEQMTRLEYAPGGPGFRQAQQHFHDAAALESSVSFVCQQCDAQGIECHGYPPTTTAPTATASLDSDADLIFLCPACAKKMSA